MQGAKINMPLTDRNSPSVCRHHELRARGAPMPVASKPVGVAGQQLQGGVQAGAAPVLPVGAKRERDDDDAAEHDDAKRQHVDGEGAGEEGHEHQQQHEQHGGEGDGADGEQQHEQQEQHHDHAHAHAGAAGGEEPECKLCARMVKAGRDKMLAAVQALPSPATQKLGAMILGFGTPRFEQLWHKLTFHQLQGMLAKAELSVSERVELLKTVYFHTHVSEEEREKLDSQKYVSQGLPPDMADYVYLCLDGKEGTAQMAEYFAALEVCKTLYGSNEEEYFNVSSTMANLFMGM